MRLPGLIRTAGVVVGLIVVVSGRRRHNCLRMLSRGWLRRRWLLAAESVLVPRPAVLTLRRRLARRRLILGHTARELGVPLPCSGRAGFTGAVGIRGEATILSEQQ